MLRGIDEAVNHRAVIRQVLIEILQPGQITIGFGIASQVTEILHRHKRAIVFFLVYIRVLDYRSQRVCSGLATRRQVGDETFARHVARERDAQGLQ